MLPQVYLKQSKVRKSSNSIRNLDLKSKMP